MRIQACRHSPLSWLSRMLDSIENHNSDARARVYQLLNNFVARGEDINALSLGYAPIHQAIRANDAAYTHRLLQLGADPEVLIDDSLQPYHGFNAYRYVKFLRAHGMADFSDLERALYGEHKSP